MNKGQGCIIAVLERFAVAVGIVQADAFPIQLHRRFDRRRIAEDDSRRRKSACEHTVPVAAMIHRAAEAQARIHALFPECGEDLRLFFIREQHRTEIIGFCHRVGDMGRLQLTEGRLITMPEPRADPFVRIQPAKRHGAVVNPASQRFIALHGVHECRVRHSLPAEMPPFLRIAALDKRVLRRAAHRSRLQRAPKLTRLRRFIAQGTDRRKLLLCNKHHSTSTSAIPSFAASASAMMTGPAP